MYSKEDRERLIADWRESGVPRATWCADPTRPSRETMRAWLAQEAEGLLDVPERDVRGRAEHAKHARYPEATRAEAVRLVRAGVRPCDAARRLGVGSASVVDRWARAAERARIGADGAADRKGARMPDGGRRPATRAELEARLAAAEAELEEARMQVDVLRELMRDPKAGDPASLSNRQKAELGERLRRDCGRSLKEVLAFLSISKSSYEYSRARLAEGAARAEAVAARVREAFDASGGTYGYRRVRAAMASGADGGEPFEASEREVRDAMREGGMVACRPRRERPWSSYGGESDERPANLPRERALGRRAAGEDFRLAHDFSAGLPWELLVTDVTEFRVGGAGGVPAAKVYLSPVVDCFDGLPASWSISGHPDSDLCDSSLEGGLDAAPEGSSPAVHSDGGATYRSGSWKGICERRGVTRSMSRKGCCPDNARAEGFFGTLKREFYHPRDWSRASPDEFARELDAYLRWYRSGRLRAFREGGRTVYDTIEGRRRRLGLAA